MQIPLTGGFYQATSVIADAQRCLNLYPERNPPDAPFPFTTYLTPGLTHLVSALAVQWRGLYTASTGDLYGVAGSRVYWIDSGWHLNFIGSIATTTGYVSMSDNGLVLLIVDGTSAGYYIDLTNNRAFGTINTPAFYGGDRVAYVDTFFVLNRPGTADFYLSTSELSAALILGGAPRAGTIIGGSGYTNGTYTFVPLTGGSGEGFEADITVVGGAVTMVTPDSTQLSSPYQIGDVLSVDPSSLGGSITGNAIVGGSNYTNGTYVNVPLTGGSGSGAKATIVISGGIVTSATITNGGQQYAVNDALSAATSSLGGTGSGFVLDVTAVSSGGSGFTWTVTAVQAGVLGFDALDIAAKSGGSDTLVGIACIHEEIWLIGAETTEVWIDAGAADFAFQRLAGVFIQHGCIAKQSIAQADLTLFWLGNDPQGKCVVFGAAGYVAKRISTHAIEQKIQKYATVSDALGFTYQQGGHVFYILIFPTADTTWVYDMATELWHERAWIDNNGDEHRIRPNCFASAYDTNVVGDWENGQLYAYDPLAYEDVVQPIVRRRGFPHIMNEAKRLSYDRVIVEMDVGEELGSPSPPLTLAIQTMFDAPNDLAVDPLVDTALEVQPGTPPPLISLVPSYTKGRSWGTPVSQTIGATGLFNTSIQFRQMGMARDMVFEVFWSGNYLTALNGLFVDVSAAET